MRKVAVTGGLSSGKTTVCRFFQEFGAYVVSADSIVHRMLVPDSESGREVIALFGEEIVSGGRIDRAKIAKRVFNNPQKLRALEKILHPKVLEEIGVECERVKQEGMASLFVVEIPLLFEIGAEHFFDGVITVLAPLDLCIERFRRETRGEREEYMLRMARQMDVYKKAERADFVIDNDGTLVSLRDKVKKIFDKLTEEPCS